MVATVPSGPCAEALAEYQGARKILVGELGIERAEPGRTLSRSLVADHGADSRLRLFVASSTKYSDCRSGATARPNRAPAPAGLPLESSVRCAI